MGQQPIPWREDQARGPGCSVRTRRGEPVPAPERGSGEARASRRLRPQGQALPPPGGRRVTAPLRRGAPACPRPGPPSATARPGPKPGPRGRSPARRCPLRVQDGGGRRATVGSRRRPSPSRYSGVPPRRRQGPTWDTPAFPYLRVWSSEPTAPRIGRGRGCDPGAGPGGGAAAGNRRALRPRPPGGAARAQKTYLDVCLSRSWALGLGGGFNRAYLGNIFWGSC